MTTKSEPPTNPEAADPMLPVWLRIEKKLGELTTVAMRCFEELQAQGIELRQHRADILNLKRRVELLEDPAVPV